MKTLRLMSVLMMALIVSIPIVIAQELNIQKFQGKDNSRGYSRITDELTIEVLVKIPGESVIDREQVRLYVEDSYAFFDTCVADGTFHKCTFVEPEFESYEPIDFTIELRDDDGNIVASETKTLIVDNVGPVIKEVHVDPPMSSGTITVSYIAEDYSRTYGDVNECSGIKEIQITAGTQTIVENGEPGLCQKDNIVEMTIETAGQKQICVAAKDHVNYASAPVCGEVNIDKSPPEIKTLSIRDEQGFDITHVHSGEERIADVSATIEDDGQINPDSVYANFNQLNPNLPDNLYFDTNTADIYTWTNIPVSEVSPCKLQINANDMLGNTATKEFDCRISADDTPPSVIGIVIEQQRDSIPLYGYGTNLIIELEDKDNANSPGIGFQSRNVFLDLSQLGMSDYVPADYCLKVGGAIWRCSWLMNPPVTTNEGNYEITILPDTADDLGNTLGTSQAYELIYDNTGPKKPEIVDFKVVSGESGVSYQGGAVENDFVQYIVRSGEFDTAKANFSNIGGDEETNPTICVDVNEQTKDCTFEGLVQLSGPYRADINFHFYDDANNKASTETTLEIYGIDNATTQNYWKPKPAITCSPRVVDRKIASLMPTIATCRIDLQTPRTDISTLAIAGPESPEECTGDVELNLNDIYMVNTASGSTHPYLFMKLEAKEFKYNKLNINCPITIFSKRAVTSGTETHYYVSRQPQTMDANFTLEFYNQPLGMANENIDRKIKSSYEKGISSWEWMGELRKIMHYAEMICWIKVIISNIIGALYMVTTILGLVAEALITAPDPTGASKAAGQATAATAANFCKLEEEVSNWYGEEINGIIKVLDAICAVVNCAAVGRTGVAAYVGGGVGLCAGGEALKESLGDFGKAAEEAGITAYPNVKDSLLLSILCLCVPGIIYNLERLRQIDCFETVCLNDYVKEQGYPESFCGDMTGYLYCQYGFGELFSLIPFTSFFDKIIDMVVTFLSDPIALFTTALGWICNTTCPTTGQPGGTAGYILCSILKVTSVIMESMAAVKQMAEKQIEFGKPPGMEYCNRAEKIASKL